ncbi:Vitamin B12 import ATP-binding protein BtuD [Streptomyces badius]
MAEFIYTMRKTRKAHGDKVILDDVTLNFLPGAKIGVVGPNGAGKSTVLKIMAGLEQPSNGDAFLSPGFTVGILMQEPKLDESKTVLENVQDGAAEIMGKLKRFNEVAELMATDYSDALMEEMGKLQEDLDHAGAWDLDAQLEQAMDALGCPPGDWPVTNLSGGEKRRVALCKLLIEAPDLLLLDEPTNHLDAESVNWLEQHLSKYAGAVVAVTHDRYFLNNVAEWILELDRGRAIPYEGNYSTYLDKKAARLKVEGRKDEKRQKRLKEELEWVRSNAKGRQTKSKARLARYEEMAAEADKMRKLDFEEIQIPPGPRLGSIVVEVPSSSLARRNAAKTCSPVAESSSPVGSSASSTDGLLASATAIATRCCCPPDNCWGRRSRQSAMSSMASNDSARAARSRLLPPPRNCMGRVMFWIAERYGSRLRAVCCQTNPTTSRR